MVIGNFQCYVCFFESLTLTRDSLCFFYWNILFLILSNLQVVASYFPLPQCIEGLKVMVESLFGATFHSIPLAPGESWHEDVLKLSLHHPEEVSTWMIGSVNSSCCLEKILGFVWFGEWKSGRIENGERIEKWKDRKDLVFSYMCLVGRVKK